MSQQRDPGVYGYGTLGEYNAWVAAAQTDEEMARRAERVPEPMLEQVRRHVRTERKRRRHLEWMRRNRHLEWMRRNRRSRR